MKTVKRLSFLIVLLAVLLAVPALAAQETQPVDEIGAARLLAAALEQGETSVDVRVTDGFDYERCLEYTHMLYPEYYGMRWTQDVRRKTASITVTLAEPEKHELAWQEAQRVAATMQGLYSSEAELLRAFHDYIIHCCEYDYETFLNLAISQPEPFTAYGALLGGKAVCDGYSSAFAMLCRAAGIPCIYVGSSELNHSWNAVFTDGQVLFVDVTYDDNDDPSGAVNTDHFLKTRDEFLATHAGWDTALCDSLTAVIWPENYAYARTLYRLGLLRGSDKGFELERQPRRDEAAVMLTRFLGLGSEAASWAGAPAPFDDVSAYYQPYIALLYERGLTAGTSAEARTYDPASPVTAQQYMTFMLRGLGYSDAQGDFVWSEALSKAVGLGILTQDEAAWVQGRTFDRGMMAFLSVKTLTAQTRSGGLLYEQLGRIGALDAGLAAQILQK